MLMSVASLIDGVRTRGSGAYFDLSIMVGAFLPKFLTGHWLADICVFVSPAQFMNGAC